LLKRLNEFGKYVEITGFRNVSVGDAKIFADTLFKSLPAGVEAQLFNADLIATWHHLYFAAINALSAFKTRRNVSKSVAVETALYASAQRQIKKAIDSVGLKPSSKNAALLIVGGDADSVVKALSIVSEQLCRLPDDSVIELTKPKISSIRREFDISDAELKAVYSSQRPSQALADLIVERVALLSTRL